MFDLTNIYKETKYLDDLFALKYGMKNPEIIRKNRLELLVEFGELANETRCFKYWSVKQTGEKEKVLEEYIDCLFMILYFCNITGVSLDEEFPTIDNNNDIIKTFLNIYRCAANLDEMPNKEDIKRILAESLYLANLLGFTIDDLERKTKTKSEIIQKRFNMEY